MSPRGAIIPHGLLDAAALRALPASGPARAALTTRQLQVATLLRRGLRHGEIATILDVSPRQVARLAAQARERSQASTTSHLVALLATADLARATLEPAA